MEELYRGAPAEEDFLNEVKRAYLECWKEEKCVPGVYAIEGYMSDYFHDKLITICDEEYSDDDLYHTDDEYRQEMIDSYEEMDDYNSQFYYGCDLTDQIADCLVYLGYVAVMDSDDEDSEYINQSQLQLIPDRHGRYNVYEDGSI